MAEPRAALCDCASCRRLQQRQNGSTNGSDGDRRPGAGIVAQGPQAVEQGGGSITLTDTVDSTKADTLGLDFSVDVQATAAVVLAGFSVGTGASDTLSVSMGNSTAYSGTVGSIGGNGFDDHFYQFGIYVYAQTDAASGQQFQVVNYWVQD